MFPDYRDWWWRWWWWWCTDRQSEGPRNLGSILWAKGSLWSYSGATVAGRVQQGPESSCPSADRNTEAHRERTPGEGCPPHGKEGASDSFLG